MRISSRALLEIGFLNTGRDPTRMMQRLRRLFARARLEQEEVNILRGISAMAQAHVGLQAPRKTPRPWVGRDCRQIKVDSFCWEIVNFLLVHNRLAGKCSEAIREDIRCVFDRDPAARNTWEVITCYPGFHAEAVPPRLPSRSGAGT